ncbi:MAG: DUF6463 family protein [Pseudomonadota bacterium]
MNRRIGIAIIVIGIGHTSLGLFRFHQEFGAMILEGLISTGTGEIRGWAFWFTFAGILMITLGITVRSIELQGVTIPRTLGWILLVGSIVGAGVFPVSGFWLMLVVSLFILIGRQAHDT